MDIKKEMSERKYKPSELLFAIYVLLCTFGTTSWLFYKLFTAIFPFN